MKKVIVGILFIMSIILCSVSVSAEILPATNVLTGTKDALNFESVSDDYFFNSNSNTASYFDFGVRDDDTGSGRGKLYCVASDLDSIAADKGESTYLYYTLAKYMDESVKRPVHLIFETYGTKNPGFWLGNSTHLNFGTLSNGWHSFSMNNTSVFSGSLDVLKIQFATRSTDCGDVQYFDNIALYPYYKIDYVLSYPDETEGVTTTKYYFDASKLSVSAGGTVTGLPDSYTLETVDAYFSGYNHLGWSTVKNASEPMTSVSLSGSDITLYPVWEKKTVFKSVDVTVYLDEAKQNKTTVTVDEGYAYKLPTYAELRAYTPSGKIPSGFRMNDVLYAPGETVYIPDDDTVEFTAEYKNGVHEKYGKLVAFESFDEIASGTYIFDSASGVSSPIYTAYINPDWSDNDEHLYVRYGDSMSNSLQVVDAPDLGNVLKVTKGKTTAIWPQLYLFNNGTTPDGLYTFTVDFVIPQSEVANLQNVNLRVYYNGKVSNNVQKTVSSSGKGDQVITIDYTLPVYQGSDITSVPKLQIFATTDKVESDTFYYVDNISVYRKDVFAAFKLSDTKTHKVFFTPGEEITVPYAYELKEYIPEGYVLAGFNKGSSLYEQGKVYTTSESDSSLSFEAVFEKKTYYLKFTSDTMNGTIEEIAVNDGDTVKLPADGLYHPEASLTGWILKGTDNVYGAGEEFTFSVSDLFEYLDGTDRLIFTPTLSTPDTKSYYFAESFSLPTVSGSENVTFATLAKFADSMYYGVRRAASPSVSDEARLADMISKGVLPEGSVLTDTVTFEEAAVVLANVLPEKFYNELCFDVDVGGAECKKLVRAGILDESTDFSKIITGKELAAACEKLCGISDRSVENKKTLYFLGDSLTAQYDAGSGTKGWPEYMGVYLTGNLDMVNYGIPGINTSTYFTSYQSNEKYLSVLQNLKKGDYVVIALGTNDSTLWQQGSMSKTSSRDYYYRYIEEIRLMGGIPVLVGPVGRNETDEDGNYKESDPDIIPVMQSVNETYGVNVPIINFKDVSFDTLSAMTAAERSEFYIDSVHYRAKGANMVASWFEELVLVSDEAQLYGLKNHCVNFKEEIPAEYFTINIGERQSETNIRYAEINGKRTEITENAENVYTVMVSDNTLIGIIEKTEKNAAVAVKTQYFHLDVSTKTATKLSLDSYMTTDGKKSIRTKEPMGIRFKSHVLTAAKLEEKEFVIDEIGFIVAVTDVLGDDELTFDFSKYVTGVAYNKESGTDIIFDATDDNAHIFSGYVKNIPAKEYKTNLVCKTYTKITVGGEQFTLYGEPVVGNVYDTAQTLLADDTLDTETKNALYQIILDYEGAIGLPGDDLFE